MTLRRKSISDLQDALPPPSGRKQAVARNFSRAALSYDSAAHIQKETAQELAQSIAELSLDAGAEVLEIGCGTGFLGNALAAVLPCANFLFTDISPNMVHQCRLKLAGVLDQAQFAVMDGENLALDRRFDLIAGSLSFQWFDNPLETLERLAGLLKGQGVLSFATIGAGSLHEWRAAVSSLGAEYESIIPAFPSGANLAGAFPDGSLVVREKTKSVRYDSARDFLDGLKRIGALTTQSGEAVLSSGSLRALLRRLDEIDAGNEGFSVTHNILFGQYRRGEIS